MLLRQDRYRAYTPPYLLYGLLGASLLLNLYMVADRVRAAEDPEAVVAELSAEPAEGAPSLQELAAEAEVVSTAEARGGSGGWQVLSGEVRRSLAQTFQDELERGSQTMTAVYGRLFMWDLNLRRDIRAGDGIRVLWRPDGEGLEVGAAWLDSGKLGKTLKIYRYKAPGDHYPSYWYADGTEVPLRLVGGPLDEYEQITALYRDGRKDHEGMDFKVDVGTEVIAPKAGTVTRVNWKPSGNGTCLELRYADGTLAKFLHLSELSVEAGQHVKAGHVIAKTGNTGRSTAPHLHYQLNRGGRSIDPLEYHGTLRRQLDESAMESFREEVDRIDRLMGLGVTEG